MDNGSEREQSAAASGFTEGSVIPFDAADQRGKDSSSSKVENGGDFKNNSPIEGDQRGRRMRLLANPTWQDFLSFLLSCGAVTLIILLLILLGWDTLRRTITIDAISVPKGFSEEKGVSPEVAARRLQDAVDMVLVRASRPATATDKSDSPVNSKNRDADLFVIPGQSASILQDSDLPTIVLPAVGASLDSFAVTIQSFLGIGRRAQITGEFTLLGGHLGLVLRKNHHVIFTDDGNASVDHPEVLLEQAARVVVDETEPKLGAILHNNIGNIQHRDGKSEEAAAEYRKAIQLDPDNAGPHYNLANVLSDQDKQEDAAAEYRIVLTHNPQDALAQVNLGNALEKVGEREGGSAHLEEAVELFQEALSELKREQVPLQWAAAQSNLGNALAALGQRESGAARLEEAVAAYRMALDELNA